MREALVIGFLLALASAFLLLFLNQSKLVTLVTVAVIILLSIVIGIYRGKK